MGDVQLQKQKDEPIRVTKWRREDPIWDDGSEPQEFVIDGDTGERHKFDSEKQDVKQESPPQEKEGDKVQAPEPPAEREPTDDYDPAVKQIAKAFGWKDRDEWPGDDDNWTPPDEWIKNERKRGDRHFKENKELRRQLRDLESKFEQFSQDNNKRTAESIKAEMREAAQEGDEERLMQLTDQLMGTQQTKTPDSRSADRTPNQSQRNDSAQEYYNDWYAENKQLIESDPDIRDIVDLAASRYNYDTDDIEEYLDSVQTRIENLAAQKTPKTPRPKKQQTSISSGQRAQSATTPLPALDNLPFDIQTQIRDWVDMGAYRDAGKTRQEQINAAIKHARTMGVL